MKWGFIYTLDDRSPNHELAAFPLARCSMCRSQRRSTSSLRLDLQRNGFMPQP